MRVSLYQCWSSQENISGEYKPDPSEHCAAYGLSQCRWCKSYQAGREPARFPTPSKETNATVCKGLLGECVNCIWPDCERNP